MGTLLIARPPDSCTSDSPSFQSSASAVRIKPTTESRHDQIESGLRLKWIRLGHKGLEASESGSKSRFFIGGGGAPSGRSGFSVVNDSAGWMASDPSARAKAHRIGPSNVLEQIATQAVVPPNVRITCELRPARPWQPRLMVLRSTLLCQGRDGPARQVNASVRCRTTKHCRPQSGWNESLGSAATATITIPTKNPAAITAPPGVERVMMRRTSLSGTDTVSGRPANGSTDEALSVSTTKVVSGWQETRISFPLSLVWSSRSKVTFLPRRP